MKTILLVGVLFIISQTFGYSSPREIIFRNENVDTRNAPSIHEDIEHMARTSRSAPETKHQYLVHVGKALTSSEKIEIENIVGMSLDAYIPYNTYLVVCDSSVAQQLSTLSQVKWVGDYAPKYKTAPETKELTKDTILVTLSPIARSKDDVEIIAENWRSTYSLLMREVVVLSDNRIAVKMDLNQASSVIDLIAEQPETYFIEPAMEYQSFNQYASSVVQTNANPAYPTSMYDNGLTGTSVVIGLADSGIDSAQCYFNNGGAAPTNTYNSGAYKIVRYVNTYGDTVDATGHGTSVAGTIAGNNYLSSSSVTNGIAKAAKIHFTDIQTGSGALTPPSKISDMFTVPYTDGVRIFVTPFGTAASSYGSDALNIDQFVFTNKDFLVVIPSGNTGTTLSSLAYSKNAIVVGSCLNSNEGLVHAYPGQSKYVTYPALYNPQVLSSFSAQGPTSDGRIKPDVVSVGEGISSAITGSCGSATVSGTSYASGTAAGAAAIVQQYYYEKFFNGVPTYTTYTIPPASQIKATLINSGQYLSLAQENGKYVGLKATPSGIQGFGRIELDKTLRVENSSNIPSLGIFAPDTTALLSTKSYQRFCVYIAGSAKFTIAWTDSPAQLTSGRILVNDLDLVVIDTLGNEYRTVTANGDFDQVNNVEQVEMSNVNNGYYAVYVYGRSVPVGSQDYSLVASGYVDGSIDSNCVNFDSASASPICPGQCSGVGTCNVGGTCTCPSGKEGIDCSLSPCPSTSSGLICGGNGVCDYDTSTCVCASGYAAPDCVGTTVPVSNGTTTDQSTPSELAKNTGISSGVLAGGVIAAFFIGAIFSIFLGGFLAVKYLEYRRDKAQRDRATKDEEMR